MKRETDPGRSVFLHTRFVRSGPAGDVRRMAARAVVLASALLLVLSGCGGGKGSAEGPVVLRIGHFPNVTHAQAVVAHHMSRQGEGWFESRLGDDVQIQWFVYNAGPSAMEGLLNGSLDLTYVGPNPALNAHVRSRGEDIRVLSGAARGGSGMVVRQDARIVRPADFRHQRIATPQLGNTQDIACRAWLTRNGFTVTPTGGDVTVIPTANPDQATLLFRREVEAVWTVEPWLSQLEVQDAGELFILDDDAVTTVLASSARMLSEHADLANRFVAAHEELTQWIADNPLEAKRMVQDELDEEVGRRLPDVVFSRAWHRLTFGTEVDLAEFEDFVAAAQMAGFMQEDVDLSRFIPER